MNLENIAVVGASGYSGEELIRLLMRHPGVAQLSVTSRQHAGKPLEAVYPRFRGLKFSQVQFIESDPDTIVGSGARIVVSRNG